MSPMEVLIKLHRRLHEEELDGFGLFLPHTSSEVVTMLQANEGVSSTWDQVTVGM